MWVLQARGCRTVQRLAAIGGAGVHTSDKVNLILFKDCMFIKCSYFFFLHKCIDDAYRHGSRKVRAPMLPSFPAARSSFAHSSSPQDSSRKSSGAAFLATRTLAGTPGTSPLTDAGGVVTNLFLLRSWVWTLLKWRVGIPPCLNL